MTESETSCAQPSRGPILDAPVGQETSQVETVSQKENNRMLARVGKPAPDFEATAYVDNGFKNIKLSDYLGKWVVLCFYPGDFTFV